MNTIVSIDAKQIHFSLDSEILHLARRKNRRLKVPLDYDATVMIKRVNGQMSFLRASIVDISADGCRLALKNEVPAIPKSAAVEGTIRLEGRQGVEVQGVVRYTKSQPRSVFKQVFGMEFRDLSAHTTTRIQGLILDLQRELFLRVLE